MTKKKLSEIAKACIQKDGSLQMIALEKSYCAYNGALNCPYQDWSNSIRGTKFTYYGCKYIKEEKDGKD